MKILKIDKKIAALICSYSRNYYPNEFGAMLRESEGIVSDIIFYPKSISGRKSISIYDWEIPLGLDYCGTVHSHPSGSNLPSRADLNFFSKHKKHHIIVCRPFSTESMAAYGNDGRKIGIEFVD